MALVMGQVLWLAALVCKKAAGARFRCANLCDMHTAGRLETVVSSGIGLVRKELGELLFHQYLTCKATNKVHSILECKPA